MSVRFDDAQSRIRSPIGFDVRRWSQAPVLGGKVEEGEQSFPILGQTSDRLLVLGAVFVGEHVDRRLGRRAGWRAVDFDGSRRQIGLDLHVGEAAPDGAREPVPSLCFTVEAFGAPAVTPVEPPILFSPSFATATSPQQSRIVMAEHDRFVNASFR